MTTRGKFICPAGICSGAPNPDVLTQAVNNADDAQNPILFVEHLLAETSHLHEWSVRRQVHIRASRYVLTLSSMSRIAVLGRGSVPLPAR